MNLNILPNLVWKSAGVFPSFLAPGPICSLNFLSDQPSILYRHRIYHLWSLLLSLKEKIILLWYSMSSDKCLQKKSTGYTAEVLIPYTIKLSFCLVWDYCSLAPDTSLRSCSPASSSSLTHCNKKADAPLKILHLYQSFCFFMWNHFCLLGECKEHFRRRGSTESCFSALSQPVKFLPHRIVRAQLCRYSAVARLNPLQEGSCLGLRLCVGQWK